MKKKMIYKLLTLTMTVTTTLTSVPATSLVAHAETVGDEIAIVEVAEEEAAEEAQDEEVPAEAAEETAAEEVTGEAAGETIEEAIEEIVETLGEEDIEAELTDEVFSNEKLNVFEADLMNQDTETLNKYFAHCSHDDLAAWSTTLSEEDIQALRESDSLFGETLDYYGEDISEENGLVYGAHFETGIDYLIACSKVNLKKSTFSKSTGSFEINFLRKLAPDQNAVVVATSTVSLSGINTSMDLTERQEGNITITISKAAYGLRLNPSNTENLSADKLTYTKASTFAIENNKPSADKVEEEKVPYDASLLKFTFTKPIGYMVEKKSESNKRKTAGTNFFRAAMYQNNSTSAYDSKHKGIRIIDTTREFISDTTYASAKDINVETYINIEHNILTTNPNMAFNLEFTPAFCTYAYDVNGGSGSVQSQTNLYYGQTQSYPSSPTAPDVTVKYDGNGGVANASSASVPKTFKGWSTSKTAQTGSTGSFQVSNTTNNATITNYAIWGNPTQSVVLPSATKSYKVNYNGNGGTASQSDSQAVATFKGWADSPKATSGVTGSYTPTVSKTLYAVWANGSVTLPTATREGYQLDKWVDENKATAGTAGSSYTPTKADSTVYAQWKANTYKIKLNSTEGDFVDAETEKPTKNVEIETTYDEITSLPIPARTGYTFKQWKDFAGNVYVPTEGSDTVNVMNLTAVNDMEVNLVAEWEAKKDTKYTVKYLFKEKDEKEYSSKDFAPDEVREGTSDASITVAAKVFDKYVTPEDQNVTIDAEGTTVVTFYYVKSDNGMEDVKKDLEDIKNRLPGTDIDTTDLINRLNEIKSIAELNKGDWDMVKQILQAVIGLDPDMAAKLADIIKSSSSLSEQDKLEILKAISNGYLTDEMRSKLIKAIQNAILSEQDKATLIEYLNSISNLTLEQQNQIKQLIEKGSSVSYTVNGVTYEIHKNQDGTLSILIKSLNGQTHVVIPDQVIIAGKAYPITEIGKDAFKNNQDVQSVQMGNNITKIGESAFEGCKNLKSVIIGPNVTEIGDKAFKDCISLTSISIPGSVKTIGNYAFYNCKKMSKVTFHEGLLQIGKKAFAKCVSIKSITIPKSVIKIKSWCFQSCTKMTTFKFKAGSLLVTMSDGVFADCKVLKSIKLPSKLKSIPAKTFRNCYKLTKCTQGVNVTEIGNNAFENCKKLRSFTVQSKVQKIKTKAFYNCKSLKKLSIRSRALTTVGSSALKRTNKALKISCPTDKISAYSSLFKGKY